MAAVLAWAHFLLWNLALLGPCVLITSTALLLNTPGIKLVRLPILWLRSSCNLSWLSASMLWITLVSVRTTSNFALLVWWYLVALLVVGWWTSWLRPCCSAIFSLLLWLVGTVWAVLGVPLVWVVVWVVQDYVWWKTFDYPFVLKSIIRCQPFLWIPFQTSRNEVNELWIRHFSQLVHDVLQSLLLLVIRQHLIRCRHCSILKLVEELLSLRDLQHLLWWHANDVDDELKLLSFIRSWKQRKTSEEFDHYASETPHVDLLCVREETQNDIRCSIKPTLNICIDNFIFKTSTTEISDDDSRFVLSL